MAENHSAIFFFDRYCDRHMIHDEWDCSFLLHNFQFHSNHHLYHDKVTFVGISIKTGKQDLSAGASLCFFVVA